MTTKIDVYQFDFHAVSTAGGDGQDIINLTFLGKADAVKRADEKGWYSKVATIEIDGLVDVKQAASHAFEMTQNLDDAWSSKSNIQAHVKDARSSMVGDVMVVGNEAFVVATIGFRALESFSALRQAEQKKVKHPESDGPSM